MSQRVAVVTGANKGIGFAIVKGLAPIFDGVIYLTARNEKLGLEAAKKLEDENKIKVKFHQLDISNQESIERFAKYLKDTHGRLDILINNAAILLQITLPLKFDERAIETMKINYTGTLNLCNALFPLLQPHARVVNLSSRAGMLRLVRDDAIKKRLSSSELTIEELNGIIDTYVKEAQRHPDHPLIGSVEEMVMSADPSKTIPGHLFPNAYSMSKVGMTALNKLQQKQFDQDSRADIIVSAVCPGYVASDMTEHKGYLTTEQGADTPIFLATLPPNYDGPKGAFWAERNVFAWDDPDWSIPQ